MVFLFWETPPILQLCTHSKNSNFCSFKNLSQFQKSDIYFWVNAYVVHTADMQILLFEEIHSVLNINQHNRVALILHLRPWPDHWPHPIINIYITYPKKVVWMLKAWKTRKYTGLNHLLSASALFLQVHPFRVKMIIKESPKKYHLFWKNLHRGTWLWRGYGTVQLLRFRFCCSCKYCRDIKRCGASWRKELLSEQILSWYQALWCIVT